MWNTRASYFRQEAGESIIDYGLHFDMEIVETYPLLEPMSDLQKTRVYYIELRACYRLPCPTQIYPDFVTLRARHEEINDMDVAPRGPPIPVLPPVLVYEPGPTPAPNLKEDLELDEPILELQNALEDQPEMVD